MNATTMTATTCGDCGGKLVPISSSRLHEATQWVRLWCKDKSDEEVHAMARAIVSKIRRERDEELEEAISLAEFVAETKDARPMSAADALREALTDRS